uniref:NADH-ubiquinone oxidoreductase chain 4 n=1 Tax=Chiridota sp. SS-2021 TaxID=2834204 RepID=A0A8E5JZJ6_9ECHN|nr:NADH dehydrogenase subunit 4 [Chiridota sp. SS-2021]
MLGVIIGSLFVSFSLLFIKGSRSWSLVSVSCILFSFVSSLFFSSGRVVLSFFYIDNVSYPLIVLSSIIIFLCIMASFNIVGSNTNINGFLLSILTIGLSLYFCFLVNTLVGYFIFFESSVIPLLVLIARWGSQKERIQASFYFVFYTLVGSFPLIISLFSLYFIMDTSFMSFGSLVQVSHQNYSFSLISIWWLFSVIGFLVKLPIYGFHLWLPKAHVEAPVAGSMLLAALLLKLGGYGLIRISGFITSTLGYYVSTFCFWGSLVTSIICLRQTDLKALIAYSSVGHMSLVAGGVLLNTSWGVSGALMLMVAHGLISSCLFCLANLIYERSGSRTLKVTRGLKGLSVLMPSWWLLSCVFNLGLPPVPNFIGEIWVIISALSASVLYIVILGASLVYSSIYSLFIFQKTCTGFVPDFFLNISVFTPREHCLVILHLVPLILILGNPGICFC